MGENFTLLIRYDLSIHVIELTQATRITSRTARKMSDQDPLYQSIKTNMK